MNKNNKRVALITGSTSGIGLAIAEQLINDGFIVAFHSRQSIKAGRKLKNTYPECSYTQADLSKPDETRHLIQQVIKKHGRLDVLVNNAGSSKTIPHSN